MPIVSAANRDRYLESRREQILEAAVKVFGKKGFSQANVADIAREAEIGKGTIYLYFKSKEDIFTSILLERTAVLHLADDLDDLDAPVKEVFRRVANRIVASHREILPLLHMAIADYQRFPEEAENLYTELFLRSSGIIGEYLNKKAARGDIPVLRQPRLTAQAFVSMLDFHLVTQEFTGGRQVDPIRDEEWIEEVVEFVEARLRVTEGW